MADPVEAYDDLMNQDTPTQQQDQPSHPSVFLIIEPGSTPLTLHDGLRKLMEHVPYGNVIYEEAIPQGFSGTKWYTRYSNGRQWSTCFACSYTIPIYADFNTIPISDSAN